MPACTEWAALPPADRLHLRPEIDWINSAASLGTPLSRALQNIYRTRSTGKQFFVNEPVGKTAQNGFHPFAMAQASAC